jgi:hypothetical protein
MFCADYDYDTLWFLAKESKPVRTESMGNRVVNVAFACPEEKIYASVTGLAQLVEDDKLVKALAPRNGLLVSCRIEGARSNSSTYRHPTRRGLG